MLYGWTCELDACDVCDGYLVLIDDPSGSDPLHALGPYPGRAALEIADRVGTLLDTPVRVVRFHATQDRHA